MVEIARLPEICTAANADDVVACVCLLHDAEQVELDASGCMVVDAFAISMLAVGIAKRHASGRSAPDFRAPNDMSSRQLFARLEFHRLCGQPGVDWGPTTTYEARQLRAHHPVFVDQLAEEFAESPAGIVESARFATQLCLTELLTNAFDHSGSQVGCFVVALRDEAGVIDCAVADGGIGIPAALRRSVPNLNPRSDAALVVDAVTRGLTSRRGRQGGLGFGNIRTQVVMRDGTMTIRSLSAWATFGPALQAWSKDSTLEFTGTVVHMHFDPRRGLGESSNDELAEIF